MSFKNPRIFVKVGRFQIAFDAIESYAETDSGDLVLFGTSGVRYEEEDCTVAMFSARLREVVNGVPR